MPIDTKPDHWIADTVRHLLGMALAIEFEHEVKRRSGALVAVLVVVAIIALLVLLGSVERAC